jgi:hypothetical protein
MKLSQSKFFIRKLGVKLRNIQWSWGAYDKKFNRVFLRVWRHNLNLKKDRVQILRINSKSKSRGYPERREHMKAMMKGAEGIGILCIAKDERPNAKVRRIKDYDDKDLLLLGRIVKKGEAFWARIIKQFPIEELNDPASHSKRNMPIEDEGSGEEEDLQAIRGRKGSASVSPKDMIFRHASREVEYTPEHNFMQRQLLLELRKEFPGADVELEKNFVAVSVRTKKELLYFEIKSDSEGRKVIRNALGQILDYAFYRPGREELAVRLIIVGQNPLNKAEKSYLDFLQKQFRLPLEYRTLRRRKSRAA